MSHPPFLKSIRPINLLSFGPDTKEIELRPLNILIGPNGCGKSNLIEILGLLSKLPDKHPWSTVIETGGVDEWIWKGAQRLDSGTIPTSSIEIAYRKDESQDIRNYKIEFVKHPATYSFHVVAENVWAEQAHDPKRFLYLNRPSNSPECAFVYAGKSPMSKVEGLDVRTSVLAQLVDRTNYEVLSQLELKLSRMAIYRDWVFGVGSEIRSPQQVGLDSYRLERNSKNLAQVLKAMRDRGDQRVFDRLIELLRTFYEPAKDVDTELLGTHLRIMIRETSGFNTPATRLSDGTLRWLALLIILLDPTPPPVICIDEPELGLHPDILPTLADLLVEASSRTQLIVTTHSRALIDAFTDTPEAVCVCEKEEGSTVISRLDKNDLQVWLDDYSLGNLWTSGQIGGNRW